MFLQTKTLIKKKPASNKQQYNVEFFHIYTDETINEEHLKSVEYLKAVQTAWGIEPSLIILIDDYNSTEEKLSSKEIIKYLENQGTKPTHYAFESKLVNNAKILLEAIEDPKTKKNYERYIAKRGKLPCSLLTAAWYLTRLGALPHKKVIKSLGRQNYKIADRLINILPRDYKPIELKAYELIKKSKYKNYTDKVQDLFYDAKTQAKHDLF
jgi:hypothetical protein